jgi:metallo-beta-lactamase family protein
MKITSHGAAGLVTGSCHHIKTKESEFLIDCGMFQGLISEEKLNYEDFKFDPNLIDFVILTHAHVDHCGRLPLLYKKGFRGKIFMTRPTYDIASLMLLDSAKIQSAEVERQNRKYMRAGLDPVSPIYTEEDVYETISYFYPIDFDRRFVEKDVEFELKKAGHLLGAGFVKIYSENKTIVFSGDIGHEDTLLNLPPDEVGSTDVMFIESTYGDRYHKDFDTRETRLYNETLATLKSGGTVLIPAFSVGRTQEVIYALNKIQEQNKELLKYNIYSDSPLSIEATDIYFKNLDYLRPEIEKSDFMMGNLRYIKSPQESVKLNLDPTPKVIISASGMCDAGRIQHHLKHYLWQSSSKVIFVGYQAEDTLGRKILDGFEKVSLLGENIVVRAKVVKLDGFSGHADKKGLLKFIHSAKGLKKIFLIHGEESSLNEMKDTLKESYDAKIVNIFETIEI